MTYIKNNINLIAQFNELKNTYSNVSTTIIKVIEQSVMTKFLLSIPSYFHTISASTKTDLCHQRLNLSFPETDVKCMVSYIFLWPAPSSRHVSEIHLHCGTHQSSVINCRIVFYCTDISYTMDTAWVIVCITIC